MVLQTRSKYFVGGCIYLGLRNQISAVIIRMRKYYWISAYACVYLTEVYFIMTAYEHSFWTDKLINFWCLMIWYRCRKCVIWLLNTWSNIITWNQKLPSRSGNSKCTYEYVKIGTCLFWLWIRHMNKKSYFCIFSDIE